MHSDDRLTAPTSPMSRVALFTTELVMSVRPHTGLAAATLLQQAGVNVILMDTPRQCGWMAFSLGDARRARQEAAAWLDAAVSFSTIVVPSPAVVQYIRSYMPLLFNGDPHRLADLENVSAHTWELFTFLSDRPISSLSPVLPGRGVLIPPCPSPTFPNLREDLQKLISAQEDAHLDLIPLPHCCSWGGSFHLDMPELSAAMMDTLVEAVQPLRPDYLAVLEVGCQILLEEALDRRGWALPVYHLAQVLTGDVP